MKIYFLLFSLFFLVSCESYKVMYITELSLIENSDELYNSVISSFYPNMEMDKIMLKSSQFCSGIETKTAPIFICKKGPKVLVLSSYKGHFETMPDAKQFRELKKSKYESELLALHDKVVSLLESHFKVQKFERITNRKKLSEYIDVM